MRTHQDRTQSLRLTWLHSLISRMPIAMSLVLLLVTALASLSSADEPNREIGGSWRVVSIGDRKLKDDEKISLILSPDNSFYGQSTVNNYGGTYNDPNSPNSFSKIRQTLRAGTQEAMDLETLWLKTMERTNRIVRKDANLNFYQDDTLLATLSAVTMVGTWKLSKIDQVEDEANFPKVSLVISADGRISGTAGVNRMIGQLGSSPDKLFDKVGTTRMAGPPELMKLEQGFLKALRSINRYENSGNTLSLYADDKLLLQFEISEEQEPDGDTERK